MAKKTKKSSSSKNQQPSIPEFKIVAQPDINKGVYSNVAVIRHTQNEFMIDFLMRFGGDAQLVSRVILSPPHIISLLDVLKKNIENYESNFEKIKRGKKAKKSS